MYLTITFAFLGRSFTNDVTMNHFLHNHVRSTSVALYSKTFIYFRMPIQAPQWTEFLSCPVCCNEFDPTLRSPISLGCGHTVCKTCLSNLHRKQCPFDQVNCTSTWYSASHYHFKAQECASPRE